MRKNPASPLLKIISGGQTGADRAGLAAAFALGMDRGGWIPKGGRTEDGGLTDVLIQQYRLKETIDEGYVTRTRFNVRDSDGTVIFGIITSSGSRLTRRECELQKKSFITNPTPGSLANWVLDNTIITLNVAGNRESVNPGIFQHVFDHLINAFGVPD